MITIPFFFGFLDDFPRYQKFEYALGHWLQKSTEHMLGCVLCRSLSSLPLPSLYSCSPSPGCFSLFRAKAVMDENVMHTYTKVASQPKHFVQYDQVSAGWNRFLISLQRCLKSHQRCVQGEDRWLCTLMLKQGWRVEYSAASDSFTACPEVAKLLMPALLSIPIHLLSPRDSRSFTTSAVAGCPQLC